MPNLQQAQGQPEAMQAAQTPETALQYTKSQAQQPAKGRQQGQPQKPQVDPQVMNMHRRLVMAAMKLLYSSKEAVQQILRMVAGAQSPAGGVLRAAQLIVGQVAQGAKGLPPGIEQTAIVTVAALIIELATEAGIFEKGANTLQEVIALWQRKQGGQQQVAPQQVAPQTAGIEAQEAAPSAGLVQGQMEA